jgi:predicted dehydrogenase
MSVLKVGIAGFGVVGKRRKACIDNHPDLEVVAVCDKNFLHENLADGLLYFSTYQELLSVELDVLFVCLSNDMASVVTTAGLKIGLHVFCEKPPGRNLEEIKKVVEVERRCRPQKLMYGFNHRYHDSVQEALAIIHSGKFGRIINMRGVYGKGKLITFNQPTWRTKREIAGGGVLLDQGIHMLDLFRLFAGSFTEVHSFISNEFWGHDVEDNAYAIMRSPTGVVAMINSSATQWRHRFNLDINLEKGSLILGGLLTGTKSYGAETLTVVTSDPENDMGDPKEQTTLYNKDNSWMSEINLFTNYIKNDDVVETGSSADALESMKLVYKIYYGDVKWRETYNIPNPEK